MDATALLRPGLLAETTVALGGGDALAGSLGALGARTAALGLAADEEALVAGVDPATDALVHDLRPGFAGGGHDRASAALELAWATIRAVATTALIPRGGGRVMLIAPPPDDADPAVAGLRAAAENLARTLSIEWARHGIRVVAIAPGPTSTDAELGALAAYLASPAGDYFSGTCLSLGEVALTA